MKIDLGKLRGNPEAPLLALDLFMVLLVLFNLAWMIFNTLFGTRIFATFIAWLSPDFHAWYGSEIHPNFLDYDMLFVVVYLTELLCRWAIAIFRRTYHRWFFYPFVHWYDVLGCIPVGSFRWLRILRAFALLWRLQQNGVIDLRDSWLVRTGRKYLDILTEEVADRVVINVLDGVHGEIARGTPVIHRIGREVLAPHREAFLDWLAGRVRLTSQATLEEHDIVLRNYLSKVVAEGMDASDEVRRLGLLPVVGPALTNALDSAVADIANGIVTRLTRDLADPACQPALRDALGTALDALTTDNASLAPLVRQVVLDAIVIVRQQTGVQQWKLREAEGFYD